MKKILLVAAMAVFGMGMSNAQDSFFAAGLRAAVPMGDAGDVSSFGVGLEAMYLKTIAENYMWGGSIGYTTYFTDDIEVLGQSIDVDDVAFLPITIRGVNYFGDSGLGLQADLGYAVGINDGNDGGILYQGKVVFNTEMLMFSAGYQIIQQSGDNWESIQLGASYKF